MKNEDSFMMRIVMGGVRGTTPVSHPDYRRYGGATTSVLIEDGAGSRLVIDAGTGLRTLRPRLSDLHGDTPLLMLFTHYHLDHLIGLPAFAPLYRPDCSMTFASPDREGVSVEQALTRLMAKPFWPVDFSARRSFLVLSDHATQTPLRQGGLAVRWCPVHHRNGCHAYRIEAVTTGASVVFATDLEWQASDRCEREALLALCRTPRPADILIMDGQYDGSDASGHAGWGHSTWQDTVALARAAGVQRLVVTHHDPELDDDALDRREQLLQAAMKQACLAREGMEIINRREP